MLLTARVPFRDVDLSAEGLGLDPVRRPHLPPDAIFDTSSTDLRKRYAKDEVLVHIPDARPQLRDWLNARGYWNRVAMTGPEWSAMKPALRSGDRVAIRDHRDAYKGSAADELGREKTRQAARVAGQVLAFLAIGGMAQFLGMLEEVGLGALSVALQDDFNDTDNLEVHNRVASDVGEWWCNNAGNHFEILGNECRRKASGHRVIMLKGDGSTNYAAQKATGTLRSSNRSVGLCVRIDKGNSGRGYFHWASSNILFSAASYLATFTIVANYAGNWNQGEVASLEFDATDGYTVVVNGSTIGTGTDSTYAEGVPGWRASVAGCLIDDFIGEVELAGAGGAFPWAAAPRRAFFKHLVRR